VTVTVTVTGDCDGDGDDAGDALLAAVRHAAPGIAVGKILIQRDESDELKRPKVCVPAKPSPQFELLSLLLLPSLLLWLPTLVYRRHNPPVTVPTCCPRVAVLRQVPAVH
jgi:hypothetical protein